MANLLRVEMENLPKYELRRIGAQYMAQKITKQKAMQLIRGAGDELTFNGRSVHKMIMDQPTADFSLVYNVTLDDIDVIEGVSDGEYIDFPQRMAYYNDNDVLVLYQK